MEELERVTCRLCLKECVDFKAVADCITDALDVLLLQINLAVSEEPVMCTNCAALLINCFDFKATCFYTHDYIVPFLDDRKVSKLDLREVYKSKHENIDIPEAHSVCAFCMGLLRKCTTVSLNNEKGDVMMKKLIEKYLPELDLSVIEEPIICAPCHESLKTCSRFATSCLIVEEKIIEYRKLTGADVIELADLLQLTYRNVSKVENGETIDIIKTEEKLCVDMGIANGHENGSFLKIEEQNLLPNEDVEIKTDQQDFDRRLGGVVSPQRVATKLRGRRKCLMSKGGPLKTSKKYKLIHNSDIPEAKMYQCNSCSFRTKYKSCIQDHMITHQLPSETTMYQCDFCLFRTKHKRSLRTHMVIHKNPSETTMYRCPSCSFKSKYKQSRDKHMLTHRDPSETTMYQCHCSSYQTKYKKKVRNHMVIHKNSSEMTMYQCDSCSFQTRYKSCIQGHMITHQLPSKTTMYQCDFCPFRTKHKRSLRTHMIMHKSSSETTIYRCDSCSYQTKYKQSRDKHMLSHRVPSETTMYQCDSCSFRTRRKSCIQGHMITHQLPSETTMYQCDICPFRTKHKKSLQNHMVIHKNPSETTMYQCPSCSFKSKYKQSRDKHMLTHRDPSETTM